MKDSRSEFLNIHGLRYHVRTWGDPGAAKLFFLHGWMDVSASFQFVVDELRHNWHVIAPDWRGFGLSEWTNDSYWFPDYISDLDALLDHFQRDAPANLVGHSMGGNVANLYAGIRSERVGKLVLAEGFGLPATKPEKAPERYAQWLEDERNPPGLRPYARFDEVVERLKKNNPRITDERAAFLAPHWAEQMPDGSIRLRADPCHKMVNPVLYRVEEAMACWRRITAPTLWLWGDGEWMMKWMKGDKALLDGYRSCYRSLREQNIADAGHDASRPARAFRECG
ncbi:MAG TPA: alpha/beta hydrolase [Burkholderiales bacterium]|nr:alpha/beta hydrolase [Burkholderiales bacterium]